MEDQMMLINVFIIIGALSVIWNISTTIIIYEDLRRRNVKVNFLLLRLFAPKYATQYRLITLKENGKIGSLFYHWIVSINTALCSTVLIFIIALLFDLL